MVNPKKLETGLRTITAGIPYALLLRIEAIEFPSFGLRLYTPSPEDCLYRTYVKQFRILLEDSIKRTLNPKP